MPPESSANRWESKTGSEGSREALLAAGTEIFAAAGFDGARVEAIARRAGVNKALINYHFGGKAGLYTAILEETLGTAARRLEPLRGGEVAVDQRLRRFIATFAEIAVRRPAFPAMILREVLSGGRHLDDRLLPRFLGVFQIVQEIVDDGVRSGRFRPVDPLLTHLSLVGALVFFFATTTFRERLLAESRAGLAPPPPASFIRHLQELMTRGLSPSP